MNVERDENISVEEALQFAKQTKGSSSTEKNSPSEKDGASKFDNYKHGEVVVDDKGIPGIVFDKNHKLEEMSKNDTELNYMRDLLDESDSTFSKFSIESTNRKPGDESPADKYIRENPTDEKALKLKEVRDAFRGFSMTDTGLSTHDDPRAKRYEEAMRKLRTGEVVLPTVTEYDQQLKEAKERREKGLPPKMMNQQQRQEEIVEVPKETEEIVPQIEEEFIQEEEEMNAEQRKEVMSSAVVDPMLDALSKQNDKVVEDDKMVPGVNSAPEKKQPIDLAAAEEVARYQVVEEPVETMVPEEPKKDETVTIEVPVSKADTFMQNMPDRIKEKVETAKVVKVNFAGEVNLPKTVKRLTNIDGYRRVAPKNVSSELVSRVLINSGYIGYFKACGALQWSSLSPVIDENGDIGDLDSAKVAQFCYQQLVTTSLGKMSYREFLENTSSDDIPSILHAIMAASLPDKQDVVLLCGKPQCRKEFSVNYSIAELPDYDKLTDEAKEQVQSIVSVKDIIDDAKETHDVSPVMKQLVYTVEDTGTIFVFKHRDLATIIDRNPVIDAIVERYGESAAIISEFVKEVYVKTGNTGTDEDYAMSNDPTIICEEIYRLSSNSLEEIKSVVNQIPMIEPVKYSMKGKFVCDHCGAESENPSQDIMHLVFQVALKARFFA